MEQERLQLILTNLYDTEIAGKSENIQSRVEGFVS